MWPFKRTYCEVCGISKWGNFGDWFRIMGGEKKVWICQECRLHWQFSNYPKPPLPMTEWIIKHKSA